MSQKRNERQLMLVLCCAVMGCYALAYLWANLCNRHAFNIDMYADAQVAACSGDRIEASPVRLARDGDGYRYEAYPATVKEELFTPERKARSVLILSESVLSETSSFRELEDTPGAMEDVMSRLELMDAVSNRCAGMWIYRLLDPSVVR